MRYARVLLKLSGEVLGGARPSTALGAGGFGLDGPTLERYAGELKAAAQAGVQLAVVIGGGNIYRGIQGTRHGTDRVTGDYMGMLATVINAAAMADTLQRLGQPARVLSALEVPQVAELYTRRRALELLESGQVVFLAGGTGNPFFTTDSAAALRACELGVQALLKGTKVRGVYSADPVKVPDAVFYPRLSFKQAISERLGVMDTTALALCMDNHVPVHVFKVEEPGNLLKLLAGEEVGTLVEQEG
jgi:uridylate kinase